MNIQLKQKEVLKNILIELNDEWILSREDTLKILQAENMIVRPYYYPPLHEKGCIQYNNWRYDQYKFFEKIDICFFLVVNLYLQMMLK